MGLQNRRKPRPAITPGVSQVFAGAHGSVGVDVVGTPTRDESCADNAWNLVRERVTISGRA
jgi:hypothetical protein